MSSGANKRLIRAAFKKPPFRIEEKGWGEFDMTIVLTGAHKGGDHTLEHDLNFQSERYEATHTVVCMVRWRGDGSQLTGLCADVPESKA